MLSNNEGNALLYLACPPTEFDKLLKEIGSTGINAFTGWEQTTFFNQFSAEQLEKWLDIYAERFQ